MPESAPLLHETVIFTGTLKSEDVFEQVRQYGGEPVALPLIKTEEIIGAEDEQRLHKSREYDWLIFTSQNAVKSFAAKMDRHGFTADGFEMKVAAVGTRTAAALEEIGFTVRFIPTVFSADTFVKEFQPEGDRMLSVLFLRGNLAGSLIREELPFAVDEWTVYETVEAADSVEKIIAECQSGKPVSLLFASPSAVGVFHKYIVDKIDADRVTVCAIGHVTEKALSDIGVRTDVKPETYTLQELVNALAKRKEEGQ